MKTNDDSFFTDSIDPRLAARELTAEAMCKLLIWMADADRLEDRGLRTSVALYCIRPDLIDGKTLGVIGYISGQTRQQIHKLAEDFRFRIGYES